MILDISIKELVDPSQIGWVSYQEGDAIIRCKVIRTEHGRRPFLSHVTGHTRGITVDTVMYQDQEIWKAKSQVLLTAFRSTVGDDYFFRSKLTSPPVKPPGQMK